MTIMLIMTVLYIYMIPIHDEYFFINIIYSLYGAPIIWTNYNLYKLYLIRTILLMRLYIKYNKNLFLEISALCFV